MTISRRRFLFSASAAAAGLALPAFGGTLHPLLAREAPVGATSAHGDALERLVAEAATEADGKRKTRKTLAAIGKHLSQRVLYEKDARLLTTALDTGTANCLVSAKLYLAVTDALGLSLSVVTAPGHAYVRAADGTAWDPVQHRLLFERFDGAHRFPDQALVHEPPTHAALAAGTYFRAQTPAELDGLTEYAVSVTFAERGDYEQAETHIREAEALNPTHPAVLQQYAVILAERAGGDPARLREALAKNEAAIARHGANDYLDCFRGRVQQLLGAYEDAERSYRAAINENPDNPHAQFHLGLLRFEQGEEQHALGRLGKALALARGLVPHRRVELESAIHTLRGAIYFSRAEETLRGKWADRAEREFDAAVALDGNEAARKGLAAVAEAREEKSYHYRRWHLPLVRTMNAARSFAP